MPITVTKRVDGLRSTLAGYRRDGQSIGFVPTMGALHEGHLSLIRHSVREADRTVCSVFVNPTQFNETQDLETYPRNIEGDLFRLLETGTDVLFVPSEKEMYPEGKEYELDYDFEGLADRMEGAYRPGHFEGVVQIVHRLLDIVQPDFIVMGQKDYQQWAIVRNMALALHPGVEVLMGRTVREDDGLALSSRNGRLDDAMRTAAPVIYHSLQMICYKLGKYPPGILLEDAKRKIEEKGLKAEYVELVDGHRLLPVRTVSQHDVIVACAAAWAGEVRLIDNVICKENPA